MSWSGVNQVGKVEDIDILVDAQALSRSGVHHLVLGAGNDKVTHVAERESLPDSILTWPFFFSVVGPDATAAGTAAKGILPAASHLVKPVTGARN